MLLEEGIARLRPFGPICQGVDVAALARDAGGARERLLRLGPDRMGDLRAEDAPRVRLARAL